MHPILFTCGHTGIKKPALFEGQWIISEVEPARLSMRFLYGLFVVINQHHLGKQHGAGEVFRPVSGNGGF